MSISRFFWWIYQLPPDDLILMLLACTLAFVQLHCQLQHHHWRRPALIALLAMWTAATLWVTILNRTTETVSILLLTPFHFYREFLDTENLEILRSSFMNVALFYPAGLLSAALMPDQWSLPRRLILTACLFAGFSLSIEVVQYVWLLGNAEIDDVILNALGAVLGALLFLLGKKKLCNRPYGNGFDC